MISKHVYQNNNAELRAPADMYDASPESPHSHSYNAGPT